MEGGEGRGDGEEGKAIVKGVLSHLRRFAMGEEAKGYEEEVIDQRNDCLSSKVM